MLVTGILMSAKTGEPAGTQRSEVNSLLLHLTLATAHGSYRLPGARSSRTALLIRHLLAPKFEALAAC